MSLKSKKIIIMISAAFLLCGAMLAGLYLSGNFSQVFSAFGQGETSTTEQTTIESTEPQPEKIKTQKPEKIRGIWFTAGVDYMMDPDAAEELIIAEIESKIDDIKSMGFNSIFIDYETDAVAHLFARNGEGRSYYSHCIQYAVANGIYIIAVLPLTAYVNDVTDSLLKEQDIKEYFLTYNVDAALLSDIDVFENAFSNLTNEEKRTKSLSAISDFYSIALSSDNQLFTGAVFDGAFQDLQQYSEQPAITSNSFIYADLSATNTNNDSSYKEKLDSINTFATTNGLGFITGLAAGMFSSEENANGISDIIGGVSAVYVLDNCLGIAVRSYTNLKNDNSSGTVAFMEYLKNLNKEDENKEFVVYNHSKDKVETDESKINFTGSCNPAFPLTCNGKSVSVTKIGDFSVEFDLKTGVNDFVFKHNDKSFSYQVTYVKDILKSVSPKGKVSAPGGTRIDITAVALRDSEVKAVIKGTTVKLTQGKTLDFNNEEKTPETSSDFVTYYGNYTLPAGKSTQQNLGSISVQAKHNGLSKKISGATVIVIAKPPETTTQVVTTQTTTSTTTTKPTGSEATTSVTGETSSGLTTIPESTTVPVQAQQLTPYKYAGIPGTSRMCEINVDYCEAMPFSPFNNVSYPLTTPLLRGMFDYIDAESSFETYTYYHLRSGKRVYRNEVKVIDKAFNLPLNKVQAMKSSTNGDTDINLALSWKVPINVIVKGQNYAQTYNSREFGVWAFTGNSIEFTFSHTSEGSGAVNVTGSNTISSAEWSKNAAKNTVTLRLYFRRAGVFYGYTLSYNSDGSLKISIKNKPSTTLSGYKILLDPGHGGTDPGAICISATPANMKHEKNINLALALKVRDRLNALGATVIMTRADDRTVQLDTRRKMIYDTKPDMSISIHCDSVKDQGVFGPSSYYYYAQSFPLANAIHKQILNAYANGIQPTKDRHTQFYPFRITRVETCPSILIEYGFVSNLSECRALQNNENQNKLAEATVQGIIDYMNAN